VSPLGLFSDKVNAVIEPSPFSLSTALAVAKIAAFASKIQ
jgi:hypothetical protein